MQAMCEVSAPVVAIAFILAAVFIPVAFLGGISGQIYKQFALTIAASVLLSAFNALSLSPALSAMLLRPKADQSRSPLAPLFDGFNRAFGWTTGPLSDRREVSEPPHRHGPGRAGHLRWRGHAIPDAARRVPAGRGPGALLRLGPPPRCRVDGPHRPGHAENRVRDRQDAGRGRPTSLLAASHRHRDFQFRTSPPSSPR